MLSCYTDNANFLGAFMLRFGLCCQFVNEPVKFRQVTARVLLQKDPLERLAYLSKICLGNTSSLFEALKIVRMRRIGAFRVLSQLFPRYTHPEVGYELEDLPDSNQILSLLRQIKDFKDKHQVRLSFHPDQFVLLSSPNLVVIDKSIQELDYQAFLAEKIDADVINIHAGGVYGNKGEALARLMRNFEKLPERVQSRLTLENDDVSYTVQDLLPVCKQLKIPLVYDVHHHRCNPDDLSIEQATHECMATWKLSRRGEAYFHLSSPKYGWASRDPKPHADIIDVKDFPQEWLGLEATVDIEAKSKEIAVQQLIRQMKIRN